MTGPHLGDELSALLDGELSADEAAAVGAHLSECAFCTTELAAFQRTRALVRELPALDPPHPRVAAQRRRAPALAAAAAAVALLLLHFTPVDHAVEPKVATLVEVHATSGVNRDPTQLAPAAVPVDFQR